MSRVLKISAVAVVLVVAAALGFAVRQAMDGVALERVGAAKPASPAAAAEIIELSGQKFQRWGDRPFRACMDPTPFASFLW